MANKNQTIKACRRAHKKLGYTSMEGRNVSFQRVHQGLQRSKLTLEQLRVATGDASIRERASAAQQQQQQLQATYWVTFRPGRRK